MSSAITEKYIVDYCETLTAEERLLIVKKILNIEDKKEEIIIEEKPEIIEEKKEEIIIEEKPEIIEYNEEDDRLLPKSIIEKNTRDISIREQFCMLLDVLLEMQNENIIYNVSNTSLVIDTNEFQYFYKNNKKKNVRNVVKRENDKILFKYDDKIVKDRLTKKWRDMLLIYENNIKSDNNNHNHRIEVYLFNDKNTYNLKKINMKFGLFIKHIEKQHLLNIMPKHQTILTNNIYKEKLEYYKEKCLL